MTPPTPSIDSLLEQCILALEADDQAKVEAVLSRHPEQAPALRERLAHLRALGILQAPQPSFAIPEQLGEFRLLRQIGRGGMGIVYLAEQPALQRQVALKLVHPEHLFFAGARERFRREVLAVARLQHPGIVPILTCGEANGVPYYAMDLVHGASLGEVLHELAGTAPTALDGPALRNALQRALAKKHELAPIEDAAVFRGAWTNVTARLVLQCAEALQHAHEQGVLHRDLKPSNLLLTTAGQVRVIDFGLASAEGEQRITRSGATLGSLPYMAPEQLRGDSASLDQRTDVYQLGVTCYELLTLTLPHGDGHGDTRERILAGHVEPPTRRNPQVHADAEAVCLMAMDPDPARRYAGASAFAEDLRAFLEQRNVRARRPSSWVRLRRWARLHPAAAATTAVLCLLLGPLPLAFALQQHAANAQIRRAFDERDQQQALAVQTIETMLLRTAEARLADRPQTAKLRRQLVEDAIELYRRITASTDAVAAGDPRLVLRLAHSQSLLGSLHTDLGDLDAAAKALEPARRALRELAASNPGDHAVAEELAHCEERLALVLGREGKPGDAEACQARAVDLYRTLATQQPDAERIEKAAGAGIQHAMALGRARRFDDAAAELGGLDRDLADGTVAAARLDGKSRALLQTKVADTRGVLLARSGEIDGAAAAFVEALARLDALTGSDRDDREVREARVGVLERIGLAHDQRRLWNEALPFLDRACTEYEALVKLEPELPLWRDKLASMLGSRATNCRQRGELEAAGPDHDRAIALLQGVVAEAPDDAHFRSALAIAHAERAAWRQATGDATGALTDFASAEQALAAVLTKDPDDPQTIANSSAVLGNHAALLAATGDLDGAIAHLEQAIAGMQRWQSPEGARNRIELLSRCASLRQRHGDQAGAERDYDAAEDLAARSLDQRPDDRALLVTTVMLGLEHAESLAGAHGEAPATDYLRNHLPLARRAAAASSSGRRYLGVHLLRLAQYERAQQHADAARASFQEALDLGLTVAEPMLDNALRALFAAPEWNELKPKAADAK